MLKRGSKTHSPATSPKRKHAKGRASLSNALAELKQVILGKSQEKPRRRDRKSVQDLLFLARKEAEETKDLREEPRSIPVPKTKSFKLARLVGTRLVERGNSVGEESTVGMKRLMTIPTTGPVSPKEAAIRKGSDPEELRIKKARRNIALLLHKKLATATEDKKIKEEDAV